MPTFHAVQKGQAQKPIINLCTSKNRPTQRRFRMSSKFNQASNVNRTGSDLLLIGKTIHTLFFGDASAYQGVAELFVAQTDSICSRLDDMGTSDGALSLLMHELATSLDIVGAGNSGSLMRRHEARLKDKGLSRSERDTIRADARQQVLRTDEILRRWLRGRARGG